MPSISSPRASVITGSRLMSQLYVAETSATWNRARVDGICDAAAPLLPVASDGFREANSCHLYVSAV